MAREKDFSYPHKPDWCCWRCSRSDTRSGTSPAGWYNRDPRKPSLCPYTRRYLRKEARPRVTWNNALLIGLVLWCRDFFEAFTDTARSLLVEVVSSPAVDWVPLARVGANCVNAHLAPLAWACLAHTLIDVWKKKKSEISVLRSLRSV